MVKKEDTYEYQTDRLKTLLGKHRPLLKIWFNDQHSAQGIWFRIVDSEGKTVAEMPQGPGKPPYKLSEKTEDKLWEWVQQFATRGSF